MTRKKRRRNRWRNRRKENMQTDIVRIGMGIRAFAT